MYISRYTIYICPEIDFQKSEYIPYYFHSILIEIDFLESFNFNIINLNSYWKFTTIGTC